MSLRQEKKIFLIDLLCPKLDLLEQFGFGYIYGEGFLTLMACGWSLQNEDDSECDRCPSSISIWEILLLW